jgi:hypothetical protein
MAWRLTVGSAIPATEAVLEPAEWAKAPGIKIVEQTQINCPCTQSFRVPLCEL